MSWNEKQIYNEQTGPRVSHPDGHCWDYYPGDLPPSL